MDGEKLVAARKRLCWSQPRAAEEFAVGLTTIHRWEKGEVVPHPDSLLLIQEKYGLTPADLSIIEEPANSKTKKSNTVTFLPSEHLHHLRTLASHDLYTRLWALSFLPHSGYQPLQDAINLILKEDDTMHANQPNHHINRREALQRLIRLPFAPALLSFNAIDPLEQKVDNTTLTQYALGIAACKELVKSADNNDFVTALHAVSAYIPPLQAIVKNFSQYRKEAAGLVAKALTMQARLTWHLQNPYQALPASKEAIIYAEESGDIELQIATLSHITWNYYYNQNYKDGLLSSEQAIALLKQTNKRGNKPLPALKQSQVYSTHAIIQAKLGQGISTSLHEASEALTRFSAASKRSQAEIDCITVYPLEQAIAQYNTRHYTEALNSLGQLVNLDSKSLDFKQTLPEENEMSEVLNHAALAELKNPKRDKEKALYLWRAGALRTKALQSEQRFKEVLAGYELMETLWPNDAEVRDFYELTLHW